MAAPQSTPPSKDAVTDAQVDAFLEFMRVEKDASELYQVGSKLELQ